MSLCLYLLFVWFLILLTLKILLYLQRYCAKRLFWPTWNALINQNWTTVGLFQFKFLLTTYFHENKGFTGMTAMIGHIRLCVVAPASVGQDSLARVVWHGLVWPSTFTLSVSSVCLQFELSALWSVHPILGTAFILAIVSDFCVYCLSVDSQTEPCSYIFIQPQSFLHEAVFQ